MTFVALTKPQTGVWMQNLDSGIYAQHSLWPPVCDSSVAHKRSVSPTQRNVVSEHNPDRDNAVNTILLSYFFLGIIQM